MDTDSTDLRHGRVYRPSLSYCIHGTDRCSDVCVTNECDGLTLDSPFTRFNHARLDLRDAILAQFFPIVEWLNERLTR